MMSELKTGSFEREVIEYTKAMALLAPVLILGFASQGVSPQTSVIAALGTTGVLTVVGVLFTYHIAKRDTQRDATYPSPQ